MRTKRTAKPLDPRLEQHHRGNIALWLERKARFELLGRRFQLLDANGEDVLGGEVCVENVYIATYGTVVTGERPDKLAVGESCTKEYSLSGQRPTKYTIRRTA
jgi:hypothetical protein